MATSLMDRSLVLEFARVTEAAAINCAHWIGKGEKNSADGAAVEAMRNRGRRNGRSANAVYR